VCIMVRTNDLLVLQSYVWKTLLLVWDLEKKSPDLVLQFFRIFLQCQLQR
jgi:hypothetical protein